MSTLYAKTLSNIEKVLPPTDIQQLTTEIQGEVLTPDSDHYEPARHVWNGQIDRRPALIVRCQDAQDVGRAVTFAGHHDLLTSIRGGGHNVGGTAVCDGGLVIDLSLMKTIEVDADNQRVKVGGGVTWGELDAATQEHGLAVPGGVVSTTGVSGLTLSGGIGWLRRRYGLSCDNLIGVELVGADGRLHATNTAENPDLFWAVRGGGGNFGAVTQLEFRLYPVGPDVQFAATFYPADRAVEVLRHYRNFMSSAPDSVSSFAICGTIPYEPDYPPETHGQSYVLLAGMYAGDPTEGEPVLSALRRFGEHLTDFSGVMPYCDVQQLLDGDYPEGRQYYWKSLYMNQLDDAAIEQIAELAASRPSSLTTVDIWHLGGVMARPSGGSTAFESRDAPYLLGVESNWDDPGDSQTNIEWTRYACQRMQPFAARQGYLNFEPAEAGSAERAFTHNHEQLRVIKRQWDPNNLFRVNHNIPPA